MKIEKTDGTSLETWFQSAKKSPLANTTQLTTTATDQAGADLFQSAKKSPLANTILVFLILYDYKTNQFQSAKKSPLANTNYSRLSLMY